MNHVAPQAIVEQAFDGFLVRWRFILRDEEGEIRHLGDPHLTKLEAIADRSAMSRRAERDLHESDEDYWVLRCFRRSVYVTRDAPRISAS